MNAEARLRPCQQVLLAFTIVLAAPLASAVGSEPTKLGRLRTTTYSSPDGLTHTTATVAGGGGEHGVGATKGCASRCEGEAMECTMTLHFIDSFDDSIEILKVWDEVASGGGIVRVPRDGSLSITAIIGAAFCTDDGGTCNRNTGEYCTLPCEIAGLNTGIQGFPDIPEDGRVQFLQNTYVTQPDDPSILSDTVYFRWRDKCQSGQGDCPQVALEIGAASSTAVEHCPAVNACTILASCNANPNPGQAACVYEDIGASCDDDDLCTTDTCNTTDGCVFTDNSERCDDNDACTADSCDSAIGCINEDISQECVDDDACTVDSCDPVLGCVYEELQCDQGCTACEVESCDPAVGCVCEDISPPCNDNNACTDDSCDPVFGCVFEDIVCPDDCGLCEVASCDVLLGCVCTEDTTICDDNDACTADSCDPIVGCLHDDIICNDDNACTADSCDSDIGCVYEGIDARCDDGNICTLEKCDPASGECVQLGVLPCSDQDPCTVDSCDPDFGCVHDLTACCGITCPPTTKAFFAVWNENERRFSGAQRCVESWDSTLLSEFADGAPNQLWRVFLQTNRGKARIDGVASPVVCGEDSIDAPLLGVASRVLSFGQNVARSGKTLVGQGVQAGVVEYSPAGGISVPTISQSIDVEESASRRAFLSAAMPVDPIISAETARSIVSAEARGGVGKKGSLLVYTSVEVKWDADGNVVQDTFLELTNDYPREVLLQMYLVQGDTCMWADNVFTLTANQPIYWSARTGGPAGASPITVLGEACPDDDPTNPGGTRIRGYVMIWAVEKASGAEIRWNHLSGAATIINYRDMSAWEYNAWSFQTVAEVIHGDFLLSPYGQLDLDGAEYEYAPDQLLFDFFAAGAVLESGNDAVAFDTELTLWALNKDLR
jgi:Dictyostelium (slime mold) repeat